ncbi:helix-turn-helix domain-containing protein [Streptomyces sp. NPDC051909]|uniref:helix-turn-helix domain-containing protein n=1 Tax=Streptomyces sp. NPDC051909 TaxID=3154944 RepID=UPI0034162A2C
MGNDLLQHPRLSGLAIGLGAHIQSLPDGADASVKRLTLRFREGEISIRRALNELAEEGYLERRRVALGGGRFATRLVWYDKPGAAPVQTEAPPPPPPPPPPSAPSAPPSGPAAAVLARLRTVDSRLLLSCRDVERLAPAVDGWLAAGIDGAQITRTLTAALPPAHVPIHHPARFLAYRLAAQLPPPLPAEAPPAAPPAAPPTPSSTRPPLVSCDGCERAIRTYEANPLCAECRSAA